MGQYRYRAVEGPEVGALVARPTRAPAGGPAGERWLGLNERRDAMLYVPPSATTGAPAPLALLLHGAGGEAAHGLSLLRNLADDAGMILLAPESRRRTWDIIAGSYGPDVAFIDRVLKQIFASYAVDPAHLAISGFSDGASYALSLGLMNGGLFSHIIAFSPGFATPLRQEGTPRIFISHGRSDNVLPIAACSRRIVPRIEESGYDLRYHEFAGGHTVPSEIATEAIAWFLEGSRA